MLKYRYQSAMKDAPIIDPAHPLDLLRACPAYHPTPLFRVQYEGRSMFIKDETGRMGLGAFKALGGVYAVARLIEKKMGHRIAPADFHASAVKEVAAGMTFVCASAGNHGLAVAAGARLFGARARIHLAETVPESFAHRLRNKGAEVVRSGADYEESVARAIVDAAENSYVHLADGSWEGYTEPPRLVMEGYTVLAEEMRAKFVASEVWPSHVYLQAGVGGLAAATAFMIRRTWKEQPRIVIVEPEAAPCLKASAEAGRLVTVEGPVSDMGRLDCKTPSMLAFDLLRDIADAWVTVTDEDALKAVEVARALGFSTTSSGAAGLAACLADNAPWPAVILSEVATPES